jgi:nicotinate-nucleotide pyrophosphorylase (carboxylating)
LAGERTAINFLAFLSGIATGTELFVTAAKTHGKALILDTRKTLPGYRRLSKYAVTVGGGVNHRMGLYDMILIKDNHIDAAGSLTKAVERVREKWGARFRIEVECRGIEEVKEALGAKADIIMLDNMDSGTARAAADLGKGMVKIESSGDMTLEKVAEYSPIGVDYISVGKLTHSVKAFNFSLQIKKD